MININFHSLNTLKYFTDLTRNFCSLIHTRNFDHNLNSIHLKGIAIIFFYLTVLNSRTGSETNNTISSPKSSGSMNQQPTAIINELYPQSHYWHSNLWVNCVYCKWICKTTQDKAIQIDHCRHRYSLFFVDLLTIIFLSGHRILCMAEAEKWIWMVENALFSQINSLVIDIEYAHAPILMFDTQLYICVTYGILANIRCVCMYYMCICMMCTPLVYKAMMQCYYAVRICCLLRRLDVCTLHGCVRVWVCGARMCICSSRVMPRRKWLSDIAHNVYC